jgi:hypothetical protein
MLIVLLKIRAQNQAVYFSDVPKDSWPTTIDAPLSSLQHPASPGTDDDNSSRPGDKEETVLERPETTRGKQPVRKEPAAKRRKGATAPSRGGPVIGEPAVRWRYRPPSLDDDEEEEETRSGRGLHARPPLLRPLRHPGRRGVLE